jgi:hypothetical protein
VLKVLHIQAAPTRQREGLDFQSGLEKEVIAMIMIFLRFLGNNLGTRRWAWSSSPFRWLQFLTDDPATPDTKFKWRAHDIVVSKRRRHNCFCQLCSVPDCQARHEHDSCDVLSGEQHGLLLFWHFVFLRCAFLPFLVRFILESSSGL